MLLKLFYKSLKGMWYKSMYFFSWIVTYAKFKLNGVYFKNDFVAKGIPIVNINLKGKFQVGKRFKFNSGKYFNMIGRQQQCFFIVGKDAELIIGNNVGISGTAIACYKRIEIGDDVRIGGGTVIYDTDFHSLTLFERVSVPEITVNIGKESVIIEQGVFIGAHVTILKGVTIGRNSVIGAGSVIAKNIPQNEIWAGNPAKLIRKINI